MKSTQPRICTLAIVCLCLYGMTLPTSSHAFWPTLLKGCPDIVQCDLITMHNFTDQNMLEKTETHLGSFPVPTCFSFKEFGCKPWACSNNNSTTNKAYWEEECQQRFSYDKSLNHFQKHKQIQVSFPSF